MQQKATVESVQPDGTATLLVQRQSACSRDCHQCGGCGAVSQTLRIRAENPIGAQPGEVVYVESESKTVLFAATLVYLLPAVLFVAGYLTAEALALPAGLIGGLCLVLGMLPAFAYNRRVKTHPPRQTITGRAG